MSETTAEVGQREPSRPWQVRQQRWAPPLCIGLTIALFVTAWTIYGVYAYQELCIFPPQRVAACSEDFWGDLTLVWVGTGTLALFIIASGFTHWVNTGYREYRKSQGAEAIEDYNYR